ncbi:uncharacterized protein LOC118179405, partial [Stegodyphus dumicola]|uniref:uncharacterized protein LOC118179405 n=1 Tax=Stegodyphus dumicola TaxID=202533 RepID=UPI0015A97622
YFNAASPNWGYTYQNQVGQIVEDFVDSNATLVMYDKDDPNTFIHYSGSSTNPYLTTVSANLIDYYKKTVIGDRGSSHQMVKTTITTNQKQIRNNSRIMWNFNKANWKAFTEGMKHQINTLLNDASPQ